MPREKLFRSADKLERLCEELSGRSDVDDQLGDALRSLSDSEEEDTMIRRIVKRRKDKGRPVAP